MRGNDVVDWYICTVKISNGKSEVMRKKITPKAKAMEIGTPITSPITKGINNQNIISLPFYFLSFQYLDILN